MPTCSRAKIVRVVTEMLRAGMVDDAESYAIAFSALLGQTTLSAVLAAVAARRTLVDLRREKWLRERQGTPGFAILEPW